MAFIRITNDDGYTLLDSEVFNLTLARKGTISSLVWNYDLGGWGATITYTARSEIIPVLALSCSNHYLSVISTRRVGNTYTYVVIAIGALGNNPTFLGNYYLFDGGVFTTTGIGPLILRNAQGYVTYDSNEKYLTIQKMIDYPSYGNVNPTLENQYPADIVNYMTAGREYAAVTNKISYLYTQTYNGELDLYWLYDGIKISGNVVYRGVDMFASSNYESGGADLARNSTHSQYMIVDVTGF